MTIATFNLIESGVWFILCIGMWIQAYRNRHEGDWLKVFSVAAVAFWCFSLSDFIEVKTGAWWQPVELLVLKFCCIVAFIWCYINAKRLNACNS
ncbi:hypothetical protein L9G16_12235 [Shewanella sp. A25]|nr:hypothetical protein [Shewanella shenzhenensis]